MKVKRHGLLFTALTLVLSAALLTTTMAAPQLRQAQPMAGSLINTNVRDANTDWDAGILLEVFDGEEFIAPGSAGTYVFTIENNETAEVTYQITIGLGPDAQIELPVRYRIDGIGEFLPLDELEVVSGTLAAGAERDVTLEWEWPFYIDFEYDMIDTEIGSEYYTLPYQIQLLVQLEGDIERDPPNRPPTQEPGGFGGLWWLLALIPVVLVPIVMALLTIPMFIIGAILGWCMSSRWSPRCRDENANDSDSDMDFVMPPPTGDTATIAVAAAVILLLAGGAAWLVLRKKQKE